MTPIKYIGHRETYADGCCGSGLTFIKGQTLNVDDDQIARKMLKHEAVYVLGDAEDSGDKLAVIVKVTKTDDEDPAQDTKDAIATMDKDGLATFAKTHFSVDLNKRMGIANLRTQVCGLVDQFGLE